jgi:hypothetical protein
MSVRPIDYQMMIPKAAEVSKIASDANQKGNALQEQYSNTLRHNDENKLKQVYDKDRTFEASIKQKQERQAKKESEDDKNKNHRNKDKDKKKGEKQISLMSNSTIDIKI